MKVRATMMVYYKNQRFREGAVFEIDSEKEFSEKAMEKIEETKKASSKKATKNKKEDDVQASTHADSNEDVI